MLSDWTIEVHRRAVTITDGGERYTVYDKADAAGRLALDVKAHLEGEKVAKMENAEEPNDRGRLDWPRR